LITPNRCRIYNGWGLFSVVAKFAPTEIYMAKIKDLPKGVKLVRILKMKPMLKTTINRKNH
jgi:hypothetical protein